MPAAFASLDWSTASLFTCTSRAYFMVIVFSVWCVRFRVGNISRLCNDDVRTRLVSTFRNKFLQKNLLLQRISPARRSRDQGKADNDWNRNRHAGKGLTNSASAAKARKSLPVTSD